MLSCQLRQVCQIHRSWNDWLSKRVISLSLGTFRVSLARFDVRQMCQMRQEMCVDTFGALGATGGDSMTLAATQQAKLDAALRYGAGIKGPFIVAAAPAPELPLLVAAVEYAGRGWHVLPLHSPTQGGCSCGRADCSSVGKHPRTRNGSKDASVAPATIRGWWKKWPDANIGIATGPESGILVLDVDGAQGEQSLIDLAQRGLILPDTYTVRTGSGGAHLYFLWPAGVDVRNSARKIAPGLDIRGLGGLVAAPPSLHKSGRRYEVTEAATDPAPCPEGLLSLIQEPNAAPDPQSAPAVTIQGSERSIPQGQGEPGKFKLAVKLLKAAYPRDVVLAAVLKLDQKCEHQLGEAECARKVDDWANRYARGESLIDKESAILKPELIRLADVQARAVSWLWEPFIPQRMITLLSGDPSVGKSFILLDICAKLSRGRLLDGRQIDPATSIYFSPENPIAETIAPRIDSMGGDASKIFILKGTLFEADGKLERGSITLSNTQQFREAIGDTRAKLIVLDPVQSVLGPCDMHRANEVRPLMDGMAKILEEFECAAIFARHLSKAGGNRALMRGLGSIDFSAVARSELLAGALPDDPHTRALIHIQSNVGRLGHSQGYAISDDGIFSWTGESQISSFDLLSEPEGPDRKLTEATQWLNEKLKAGSVEQREIREQAEAAGISWRTLQRAKSALRVQSRRATFAGGSIWSLPEDSPKDGRFEA